MGATKLMTAAGGGITLDAASTASDKTITVPADNGTMALTSQLNGFRNRILNGDMRIDQRNAGASVTNTTSNTYVVDRMYVVGSVGSKFTAQQNAGSVTPPVGFSNYLGITSSAATSLSAGDYYFLCQPIEGFNTADLQWGTANAKTVTLSAWVYSSLTGTFGGALRNSAINYSYPFTYSIPVANTWTQINITIAGPTAGTWVGATNGIGINVIFGLGVGSTYSGTAGSWSANTYASATGATSVVGTNGATFYITGVQLEKGSTATSFDYRPYSTELQLAQRYYQTYTQPPLRGIVTSATAAGRMAMILPVVMRSAPTAVVGALPIYDGAATTTVSSVNQSYLTAAQVEFDFNTPSVLTAYRPALVYQVGSSSMTLSAEL